VPLGEEDATGSLGWWLGLVAWAGSFYYGNSTLVLAKLQCYVEATVGGGIWKKYATIRGRNSPRTHP
jgi:hypothetical protein